MSVTNQSLEGLHRGAQLRRVAAEGAFLRKVLSASFAVLVVLSIAFPVWRVGGLPVRAIASIALLGMLSLLAPGALRVAVRAHHRLLLLIAAFAGIGVTVSLFNGTSAAHTLTQTVEIQAQAAVNLLVAGILAALCGPRRVLWIFIAGVLLTSLVAVAQFVHLPPAWGARVFIAHLSGENLLADPFFRTKRAMGLSGSPISLATQLCLALAAYLLIAREMTLNAIRTRNSALDVRVFGSVFVLTLICAASGNRSPILGAAVLLAIFGLAKHPRLFFPGLLLTLACIPILQGALDHLESTGLRVATMEDKSTQGRWTLIWYGILLFVSHPLGYGLDFNPTRYWSDYWNYVQNMPVPVVIRIYPLHNYPLSMINIYGISLIFVLPATFKMLRKARWASLCFIPYAMHILFHNDGPMYSDYAIWFIIGAYPFLALSNTTISAHPKVTSSFAKPDIPKEVR